MAYINALKVQDTLYQCFPQAGYFIAGTKSFTYYKWLLVGVSGPNRIEVAYTKKATDQLVEVHGNQNTGLILLYNSTGMVSTVSIDFKSEMHGMYIYIALFLSAVAFLLSGRKTWLY